MDADAAAGPPSPPAHPHAAGGARARLAAGAGVVHARPHAARSAQTAPRRAPDCRPRPATQDKSVAAAAVEQVVVEGHHVDVVPHVPSNYPHFTPFIENIQQYKVGGARQYGPGTSSTGLQARACNTQAGRGDVSGSGGPRRRRLQMRARPSLPLPPRPQSMYERSIKDPDGFWAEIAEEFHWEKKVGGGGRGGGWGGGGGRWVGRL
jgi:hypothetical protein